VSRALVPPGIGSFLAPEVFKVNNKNFPQLSTACPQPLFLENKGQFYLARKGDGCGGEKISSIYFQTL
jgi:hypothetical protein